MLEVTHYMCLIIDGTDQSSFGLLHFAVKNKTETGNAIKFKLIGTIIHGSPNTLIFCSLTQDHQTGNHIIETWHRCLNDIDVPLPPTLFIQVENCSKDNNNRLLFSYVEYLILRGVFKQFEVGYTDYSHYLTRSSQLNESNKLWRKFYQQRGEDE